MSEARDRNELPDDADDLNILDELLEPELDEEEAVEDDELPEETTEDEPPPEPRRQPSARQRAAIRLRKRLEETEQENRRLRELTLTQTRPPPPQIDPYRQAELEQRELERIAMLQPHEQAQHFVRQSEQRMSRELLQAKIEVADLLDRQAFERIKEQEPMAARMSQQIENALAASRQNGLNPTREALYNQMFATEVRLKAKKQGEAQRRRGRAQIAAQTTRPGTGRSNAAGGRSRRDDDNSMAAVEARLKNVTVGDVW